MTLKTIEKQIMEVACKGHSKWNVFKDFMAMSAISMVNAATLLQTKEKLAREDEYLRIIKSYDKSSQQVFPKMLGTLIMGLEKEAKDYCGELFMSMDLGDSWKGQFFTPSVLGSAMAKMTCFDIMDKVKSSEFVTVMEPAIGSGVLVIELFNSILVENINPQEVMHVTGIDIDITAVHMAYVQLNLLHIPAVIIHGNALTVETWSVWPTLAHVLGFWDSKLARKEREAKEVYDLEPLAALPTEIKQPEVYSRKAVQLTLF